MFNVPNFDCICAAWKLWLSRLVPGAGAGPGAGGLGRGGEGSDGPGERRDRPRRQHHQHSFPASLKPDDDDDDSGKSNSKRNRHSWHATSGSPYSGLGCGVDQSSLEGFPGEPHSGSNGVPHGEYRKSWHESAQAQNQSPPGGNPVIHQSSCPSSFYRQDKPKRDFKLPLRTESCPNPSHTCSVVLEPSPSPNQTPSPSLSPSRPQNLRFDSSLEDGAGCPAALDAHSGSNTTQCRQRRHDLLSRSRKQEAFDEDDVTTLENDLDNRNEDTHTKEENAEDESCIFPVKRSRGGRTLKCKDCGGRITVSITTPTPTSANPKIYRLRR